jgi:hypothetical protein
MFICRLIKQNYVIWGETMLLTNVVVGLIQLIISIIFAVLALYIGFAVLGKITKGMNEEKELAKGNAAVGIIVAAVFVAIALVVQSGVSGLTVGINKALSVGLLSVDGLLAIGISICPAYSRDCSCGRSHLPCPEYS